MILHRHIENKGRFAGGFVFLISFYHVLHIRCIADIIAHIGDIPVIFHKIQIVKSKQRIHFIPVPSAGLIRMLCIGRIS